MFGDSCITIIVVVVIALFLTVTGCWAHKCSEAGGEVASYRDFVCVKKGALLHVYDMDTEP